MDILALLKIDLGITASAYDERLTHVIAAAWAEIIRAGASTLDATDPADVQLVIIYAAWLWRRRETGEGMPRMVQLALHNRIFSEKAREGLQ